MIIMKNEFFIILSIVLNTIAISIIYLLISISREINELIILLCLMIIPASFLALLNSIHELSVSIKINSVKTIHEFISLKFLYETKKRNKKIILTNLFLATISLTKLNPLDIRFYELLFILIFFAAVLITKEKMLGYRIHKGLFGTNRAEAKELIDFIIKKSNNLDFTDSNGNLRRTLLPEAKDAAEERIPGILGEEAPA